RLDDRRHLARGRRQRRNVVGTVLRRDAPRVRRVVHDPVLVRPRVELRGGGGGGRENAREGGDDDEAWHARTVAQTRQATPRPSVPAGRRSPRARNQDARALRRYVDRAPARRSSPPLSCWRTSRGYSRPGSRRG